MSSGWNSPEEITLKVLLAMFVLILSLSAAQADGPLGVAFVEAPEQSSGVCFADNADKGFACARQKCTANGTQNIRLPQGTLVLSGRLER